MSRCFPFPPPGYEKKPRISSEHDVGDLLAKEKHKEKEHKKEKKDGEKSKERKDKDRSKNKHKEKKDRKEKHRDKKKDKNREKDKSKTPEDQRTEHRFEIHHEGILGYDSQKAAEVGDSKFAEELGRRIRDEQVAANRMVEGFSSTMHRRTESMGASTVTGKECITGNKNMEKDKNREKDKSKTPEDRRTEHQFEIHHEGILGYDSRKAVEVGDSKFADELGRRIRDDEQVAANHMVEGLFSTMHRRTESMGASTVTGKECITGNKMVTDVSHTLQRRDDKPTHSLQRKDECMETATTLEKQKVASSARVQDFTSMVQRNENLTPLQKRTESMGTTTVMEKQRAASNHMVGDFSSAEPRNHVTGHLMENMLGSGRSKNEGTPTFNSMQKERVASNCTSSNPMGAATKRNDGIVQPAESVTSAVPGRTEIRGVTPAMKERRVFTNIVRTDQKRTDGIGLPVQKDRPAEKDTHNKLEGNEKTKEKDPDKKLEGKEKTKEKKAEDGKRGRHKDKDRSEKKRKEKDKDRHKEKKKKEKRRENGDHNSTKLNKVTENGMDDQMDSIINKILAPRIENVKTDSADGNSNKRKVGEINGFLHEHQHDDRPIKQPRRSASSSHSPVENEMVAFSHIASTCTSIKMGTINTMKVERGVDNNSNHLNGKTEVQPSNAPGSSVPHVAPHVAVNSGMSDQVLPKLCRPPVAAELKKSVQVLSRPHHPDTKYLGTIYCDPEMEELEFDDHEWLFSSENPRPNPKLEATETPPQVWAKGLHIEAADVFALPYVVPF